MSALSRIRKVNAYALKIGEPGVIVPACNIDLDQPGEWIAYFECAAQFYASDRICYYTCALNCSGNWHIEVTSALTPSESREIVCDYEEFLALMATVQIDGRYLGSPGKVFDTIFAGQCKADEGAVL